MDEENKDSVLDGSYEVREDDPRMGRRLVAARDVAQGALLIREKPIGK